MMSKSKCKKTLPFALNMRHVQNVDTDVLKGEHPYISVFQEHQRECVRQKWIELQDRLGWKERHYHGLKNPKHLTLRKAHPCFSTKKMKDAIKEASRSEKEKELCQEFMKMLEDIKLFCKFIPRTTLIRY